MSRRYTGWSKNVRHQVFVTHNCIRCGPNFSFFCWHNQQEIRSERPATPQTRPYTTSWLMPVFEYQYSSQGSVATRVRCGGMCSDHFTANLLLRMPIKVLKIDRCFINYNKIWRLRSTFHGPDITCWYVFVIETRYKKVLKVVLIENSVVECNSRCVVVNSCYVSYWTYFLAVTSCCSPECWPCISV